MCLKRAWHKDSSFRSLFNSLMAECTVRLVPLGNACPVTASTLTRPFESVLLDSPDLARHPEHEAFAVTFRRGR